MSFSGNKTFAEYEFIRPLQQLFLQFGSLNYVRPPAETFRFILFCQECICSIHNCHSTSTSTEHIKFSSFRIFIFIRVHSNPFQLRVVYFPLRVCVLAHCRPLKCSTVSSFNFTFQPIILELFLSRHSSVANELLVLCTVHTLSAMHHAASYDTFATFTQLVIIVFLRFILYILFINKQKWTRRLHDNLIYTKNFLCMLRMRLCNQR